MEAPLANAPIAGLDLARIGRCLVNLMAVSANVGHRWVADTARDYLHEPEDTWAEAAFVYDVFRGATNETAQKWFGSELAAASYITRTIADFVEHSPGSPAGEVTGGAQGLPNIRKPE